ncbi:MAG TPA: FAD:protein FMN transferase [Brevundimonas sp.]|jgi:thiamine biosynthesis lipoprotein|uniref:FAD:protein FMN transferase n=1 Tax=Brevundimonas sp. TaxID=1871086 RepID=UPI002E0F2FA5|nr:FAD:protein FMN transferase [Brevundimonas sp.]
MSPDAPLEDRLFIPAVGTPPRPAPGRLVWTFEDSRAQVRLVPPPGALERPYRETVTRVLDETFALLDRRSPASELARFNGAPAGTWRLSDPLWAMLNSALDLADEVNGAWDPTLGALTDFWIAAGRALSLTPPDEAAIAPVRAVSGWQGLRLHRPGQAAVQPGGTVLDFDDVAAALACDRVMAALTESGVEAACIRSGDNALGRGLLWDGQPWWADLWPAGARSEPRLVGALLNLGLGVSGLDPDAPSPVDGAAGRRVAHGLVGVATLDPSCFRAQALARALHVLGPYEGPAFAEAMDLPALFVERGPGGLLYRLSPALAAMEG